MAGLILGGIAFSGFEIPDKINFGGKQQIAVHRLIGGERVLDAMGSDPEQIAWSGRFRGADAIARAQAVDEMRIAGAQVDLAWLNLFRTVVIASFHADTEKAYEVPYSISCEVVSDVAAGLFGLFSTFDALIGGDLSSLMALPVSDAAGTAAQALNAALGGLGSLTAAPAATRKRASAAANTASLALNEAYSLEEGILGSAMPGGMPEDIAAWLTMQAVTAQQHASTLDAMAYVGRIGGNLALVTA